MKKSVTVLAVGAAFAWMDAALAQAIGKVELTGLPANFDPRTLRVETDAGIHVGEVAVQDVSRAEAVGKREADLEERIQRLKDEKGALDVEGKTAELMRDYLAGLKSEKAH